MMIIDVLVDLISTAIEEDYYDREPGDIKEAYRKDTGAVTLDCLDIYMEDSSNSALNVLVGDRLFQIKITELTMKEGFHYDQ